jgi:hypothetical protein
MAFPNALFVIKYFHVAFNNQVKGPGLKSTKSL